MAELNVVTAISDPEFESFVASTLFSQGWSVIFRAIDLTSLSIFLGSQVEPPSLLIYSTDIQGLENDLPKEIEQLTQRCLGFAMSGDSEVRTGIYLRPTDPSDLISLVKSPSRTPLMRNSSRSPQQRRARIIGISGANHGDGVTTTAINLAYEIVALQKRVLLIDAHFQIPAIATQLGERNVNRDKPQQIAAGLELFELTQENALQMPQIISTASSEVDFILIDLAVMESNQMVLTDRRWGGSFINWAFENIDDLWVLTSPQKVSALRLREITAAINNATLRARLTFILSQRHSGKKGDTQEENFLATVTPLRPHAVRVLPIDLRGVLATQTTGTILISANPRGTLRRAIEGLAKELIA